MRPFGVPAEPHILVPAEILLVPARQVGADHAHALSAVQLHVIDGFRAELKIRLNIEKEYIIQELSSITDYQERLELLGKFNEK